MDWFLRCNLHFCSLDFDLNISLWAQKVTGMFAGWGWGVLPCIGYIAIVPVGMVWLLTGLLWDRVYK